MHTLNRTRITLIALALIGASGIAAAATDCSQRIRNLPS